MFYILALPILPEKKRVVIGQCKYVTEFLYSEYISAHITLEKAPFSTMNKYLPLRQRNLSFKGELPKCNVTYNVGRRKLIG